MPLILIGLGQLLLSLQNTVTTVLNTPGTLGTSPLAQLSSHSAASSVIARLDRTQPNAGAGVQVIPPLQILALRSSSTLIICLALMYIMKIPYPILGPPKVRRLLLMRGVFGFFGVFGVWNGLGLLSASDARTLTFLTPCVTCIMSYLILDESYTSRQILCTILSLFGVVLIARPSAIFGSTPDERGELSLHSKEWRKFVGMLCGVVGVTGGGGAYTVIAAIGTRAHSLHIISYFSFCCVVASTLLTVMFQIPFVFPSNSSAMVLLSITGLLGFAAQGLLTLGLMGESAGRGAGVMYLQIVFVSILERIAVHPITAISTGRISTATKILGWLHTTQSLFGGTVILAAAYYGTLNGPLPRFDLEKLTPSSHSRSPSPPPSTTATTVVPSDALTERRRSSIRRGSRDVSAVGNSTFSLFSSVGGGIYLTKERERKRSWGFMGGALRDVGKGFGILKEGKEEGAVTAAAGEPDTP